jgi:RNA methyltransferase, TrmH family
VRSAGRATPPQPIVRLTSRQHPLVARFRTAARHSETTGVTVVEGATLLDEAWRAGWAIEAAAFSERALDDAMIARLFERLTPPSSRVVVPERVLRAMSPARTPSGVVALARTVTRDLDSVFAGDRTLVALAVDVQDPGNLGGIVRAAEATGATGVIAAGASADPYGWKALRGAMGSAFRLPVVRVSDAGEAVHTCRARGVRVIAASLEGTLLDAVALDEPCAILLGAEGTGLPPHLLAAADVQLTIPMQPPVESLNVAVAAGIILYEARRQRTAPGGGP